MMACDPQTLKNVALFELLDADELAVLAAQVERREFDTPQRIYKMGEPGGKAYVMVSGKVRLTTIDADHQEVVLAEPRRRAKCSAWLPCWKNRRTRLRRNPWSQQSALKSIATIWRRSSRRNRTPGWTS
jgi:CRP-like cAMP-binding protein